MSAHVIFIFIYAANTFYFCFFIMRQRSSNNATLVFLVPSFSKPRAGCDQGKHDCTILWKPESHKHNNHKKKMIQITHSQSAKHILYDKYLLFYDSKLFFYDSKLCSTTCELGNASVFFLSFSAILTYGAVWCGRNTQLLLS